MASSCALPKDPLCPSFWWAMTKGRHRIEMMSPNLGWSSSPTENWKVTPIVVGWGLNLGSHIRLQNTTCWVTLKARWCIFQFRSVFFSFYSRCAQNELSFRIFVHRVDSIEAEDPGGDCWNQGQTFACLAQRHTFLGGDTQCSAKSVALRCTLCAWTAL